MSNIYTKGGDKGKTSLIGGTRVSKTDLQVECYGTIDELNSVLGVAYAASEYGFTKRWIRKIQEELFTYSAELAADKKGLEKLQSRLLTDANVKQVEDMIDWCTVVNGMQKSFVIPGENLPSAFLHMARTVARRAERLIIRLSERDSLREFLIQYINRLSDGIYALARLEETFHQLSADQAKAIDRALLELDDLKENA